jgi:hypothetical protein
MAETLAATNINRVQYTGLDFDTHNDDLRSRMQVQFASDYNDFATSSLAIMLLDLVAFGLDTLSFYLDRRASDTYLGTARTRGGVARLTRQLGYKMAPAVASSVDLEVHVAIAQVFPVPIPQRFQFKGPFDLIFEASEAVVISAASTAIVSVPCYEGQSVTDTFTSDGTAFQVFTLARVPDGAFVVLGSVFLTVNGTPWTEVPLLDFDHSDQFEVGYNDDPPTLRFGNGITGNIPALGATIDVRYVASHGLTGIVNKETIDDVVSQLVVMATPIELIVNNPAGSIGGDDPEDLDKAKALAPQVWKARDVAVVRTDYDAIANAYADPLFGRVAVAQAIAVHSAAQDTALQTLLADIVAQAAAAQPIVNPETDAIRASLNATLADLASMLPSLTDIATKISQAIVTDAPTALFASRTVKNSAQEVQVEASTIQTTVVLGKQAVDAVPTGSPDQLTVGTKDALKAYFDQINANALSLGSAATTIETSATASAAILGTIIDTLDDIGIDLVTAGTLLAAIETLRQAIIVRTGVGTPVATLLFASLDIIDAAVEDTLAATTALTTEVYNHVDQFLASDCNANLVSVPILSKDGAGFYVAPSRGLVRSLQAYLDARKEVTQVVSVVSGAFFLIPTVMEVEVGVLPTFSASVTTAAVIAAIDGLLKDRAFGSSLYRSDVVSTCLAVPGVGYVNVTLLGYQDGAVVNPSLLDVEGNLIINDNRVITKGSVAVTAVALTRTLTS